MTKSTQNAKHKKVLNLAFISTEISVENGNSSGGFLRNNIYFWILLQSTIIVNPQLQFKIAVDLLDWNMEDARFAAEGRLLYMQPAESNWNRKRGTIKLSPVNAILITLGKVCRQFTSCIFSRQQEYRKIPKILG